MIVSSHLPIRIVVGVYLLVITMTGAFYSKYMASSQAYFKAGNAVPWWAAGISMYMSNFSAYTFVGIGSLVYREGFTGLLLETGPAIAFLVAAVFFARRWHRLNLVSPPEYLEARFNPITRKIFSLLGISTTFIASGMRLYAMCKFAEAMMGIPLVPAIVVTGSVIAIYSMLGGLWAVIITDFIQFVVLYLAALCLMAMSIWTVFFRVGWSAFLAHIPPHYATFPGANSHHAWGWLLMFWFSYLLDYNGDWGVIQRMCCTPSEGDARKSAFLAMTFSIPHAFLLIGPCFLARVMFSQAVGDPTVNSAAEGAYGTVAALLLPPGLVGVVTAAMFSATMSTLSVGWTVRSASLVNDLYVRFFRPQARDREQILVGRLGIAFIGVVAIAVAIIIASLSSGLFVLAQNLVGLIVIPLITPLLGALLVRRTKDWAGLGATAICVTFALVNKLVPALLGRDTSLPFEWEVPIEFLLGMALIGFSGWLPHSDRERQRQDDFHGRLTTPRHLSPNDTSMPPPLGVISGFVLIIGLLVLCLAVLPQTNFQRWLTIGAALTLLLAGALMRTAQRRMLAQSRPE